MEDDMPAEPWKELVPNTGPIQRFVLFESQMLTTIGLSEYEVTDFNLALTLLRGFGVLSKGDSGVRGAQAGPPFATPEGQCIKRLLSCQYIWQPRPATLPEAFHQASHAYGVVFGEQGRASKANAPVQQATGQWVNAGNPNLVLTALYKASNTLTARWLNPTPEPQPLLLDATFPHESPIPVNLLGEPQPQPEQGNNLAIGPCDLLTVTLPLRYNEAT
jgi:hypothetical protein